MITETSARRDVAGRRQWMDETIAAVADVRAAGLPCLLYTSDAADERSSVDLGGRRIIKKKNNNTKSEIAG